MTYFCMILLYCNITTLQGADAPRLAMRSEPIGIPNIGNSCFMNAALQALMSLELFVVDLINTSEDEIKSSFSAHIRNALQDNPDVENDIRFYQDFYAFAKAYQAHKASVLDTSYTNKFFEELRGKFACGQQDSASEFLHHLIRLLSISSPYIKHLFSWRVTLKSLLPGGKSITQDTQFPVILLNKGDSNDRNLFKVLFIPWDEKPTDYFQGKWKIRQPAPYLVTYPEDLAINTFAVELLLPANFLQHQATDIPYALRSIVLKNNNAGWTGHYKALVRYGNRWWEVNDDQARPVDAKKIEEFGKTGIWNSNFVAVMFFYECVNLDARLLLEQFHRDLTLLATCASLQKE